jgi:hypothetical protein
VERQEEKSLEEFEMALNLYRRMFDGWSQDRLRQYLKTVEDKIALFRKHYDEAGTMKEKGMKKMWIMFWEAVREEVKKRLV